MSLYKNIGPITYLSETQKIEIFSTETYYVIQLKNPKNLSSTSTIHILQTIALRYNQKFRNEHLLQVYSQPSKPPSLVMCRKQVQFWNLEERGNIEELCLVCGGIVNSLGLVGGWTGLRRVERSMVFVEVRNGQIFYLYIPQQDRGTDVKQQNQNKVAQHELVQIIIQFLNDNFRIANNISYKLLVAKLKKCTKLTEMKEELEYFQKIYEIGVKKMVNGWKEGDNREIGEISHKIQKFHRVYRKKLEQQQQKTFSKRLSSSSHTSARETHPNKYININFAGIKLSKQIDLSGNKNTHYDNCSTRNKSSNAIHKNSSSFTQRSQPHSVHKSKSLFLGAKSKGNMRRQSRYTIYRNESLSNKTKNMNQVERKRQLKISAMEKSSTSEQNIKDEKLMKDMINRNLTKWKDKRNKQKNIKLIAAKELSSKEKEEGKIKSLKRKNKNSCVDGRSGNWLANQRESLGFNGEEIGGGKQSWENQVGGNFERKQHGNKNGEIIQEIQLISNNSQKKRELQDKKIRQTEKIEKIMPRQSKIQAIIQIETKQQKKLYNQNDIKEIKFTCVDHEQTSRQNQLPNSQKPKQPEETTIKIIQQKTKMSKDIQDDNYNNPKDDKQKTARKTNSSSPQQKLLENYLKTTQNRFSSINYIGQCVTKMPNYIAQIEEKTGDKYLWQLPAFILYKEFYHRRQEILEGFKENVVNLVHQENKGVEGKNNRNRNSVVSFIEEIEKQNIEIRESLEKLLKLVKKKIKKYNINTTISQQIKNSLTIHRTSQKTLSIKILDEICINFLGELQQLRSTNPEIVQFEIEFIDAQILARGGEIDIEERTNIELQKYESGKTIKYFTKRMTLLRNGIQDRG